MFRPMTSFTISEIESLLDLLYNLQNVEPNLGEAATDFLKGAINLVESVNRECEQVHKVD